MAGLCSDATDLLTAAADLQKYRDLLNEWLNGSEDQFVVLGGVNVPTIRNLVHMIDERESAAAQRAIDEGINQVRIAREQIIAMRDAINVLLREIETLKADAITLPAGAAATATYDPVTRTLTLGIPRGVKGEKGEDGKQGPMGLPPLIDFIVCGGACTDDKVLTIIQGGAACTMFDNGPRPQAETVNVYVAPVSRITTRSTTYKYQITTPIPDPAKVCFGAVTQTFTKTIIPVIERPENNS